MQSNIGEVHTDYIVDLLKSYVWNKDDWRLLPKPIYFLIKIKKHQSNLLSPYSAPLGLPVASTALPNKKLSWSTSIGTSAMLRDMKSLRRRANAEHETYLFEKRTGALSFVQISKIWTPTRNMMRDQTNKQMGVPISWKKVLYSWK